MAAHVIRGIAARNDHRVKLGSCHRVGFGVDGDRVAVFALVSLGTAGPDDEDVGTCLTQAVVRVPQLEVFVECLGQDGDAHPGQLPTAAFCAFFNHARVLSHAYLSRGWGLFRPC